MTTLIIFRLIHVLTGVFWAGAVMLAAGFLIPTARKLGPDGSKFMATLAQTNKYPVVVNIAAALNIISGLYLYDKLSAHFSNMAWIGSGFGMSMTIGGICAIIALLYGTFVVRPAVSKMGALGQAIMGQGSPPSEEQQEQMGGYQRIMTSGLKLMAVLLIASVVTMAIGRYLN